jgi:hypothetical protein
MPLCSVLLFLVFMLDHCMFWYRWNYENVLEMIDLMYVAVSTFCFLPLFLFQMIARMKAVTAATVLILLLSYVYLPYQSVLRVSFFEALGFLPSSAFSFIFSCLVTILLMVIFYAGSFLCCGCWIFPTCISFRSFDSG